MANGREPKTTGEHIIALYGHITGIKREINDLHKRHDDNEKNKIISCGHCLVVWDL